MSLTVTVLEPSDNTTETDYTDFLRADLGFELGGRAFDGEADGDGTMILGDEDSVITPLDDVGKGKRIFIEEDASGAAKALFVGRIWDKDWDRGPGGQKANRARQMTLGVVDANMDLSGIIVDGWERPAEEPYVRVQALLAAYLNGSSSTATNAEDLDFGIWGRVSTVIGDAYVNTGGVGADMPANTYNETDPRQVLRDCCEWAGYDAFVIANDDRTLDLFFDEPTSTVYTSVISISDNPADIGTANVYQPEWLNGSARHQDGSQQGSGVLVIAGNETRKYWQLGTSVTDTNDKWEFNERTDATAQGDINQIASRYAHFHEQEAREINCTLLMPVAEVHKIKPGHRVEVKRAYAAAIGGSTFFRAVSVRYIWHTPEYYLVALTLGIPVKLVRRRGPRIPLPPTPPTEGGTVRLYPSDNISGVTAEAEAIVAPNLDGGDAAAGWETVIGTADYYYMYDDPQSTNSSSSHLSSWAAVNAAAQDVLLAGFTHKLETGDPLLDIIQGGGTMRGQFRMSSRFGIGVDEGAQDNRAALAVRVYRPSSGTFVQTLAAVGTSAGAGAFVAANPPANRSFVASLSAYAGAQNGDYIVVDIGTTHTGPTSGATGASLFITDNIAEGTDLPEDELSTNGGLNSWIEFRGTGTSGDTPSPTVQPGDETFGEDHGCYAPCGHSHSHGFLADDGTHMHDADQIDGLDELVGSGGSSTSEVVDHGTMGAAETFDFADGSDHEGTLDANLTVSLAGATDGEAAFMTWKLTQDGTGGHTIDLPATVVNASDVETNFDTTAAAVNVVTIFSYDGGASWYAFLAGGGGTAEAMTRWEVLLTEDGSEPLTTEDGLDWLYVEVAI